MLLVRQGRSLFQSPEGIFSQFWDSTHTHCQWWCVPRLLGSVTSAFLVSFFASVSPRQLTSSLGRLILCSSALSLSSMPLPIVCVGVLLHAFCFVYVFGIVLRLVLCFTVVPVPAELVFRSQRVPPTGHSGNAPLLGGT